jgi:transcriptional regulator with XRE-family HTH domain
MHDMTLRDYRGYLGWSAAELARRAGLDAQTVRRAEKGEPTFFHTAGAIATALSKGLGRTVRIEDIEGLNVRE